MDPFIAQIVMFGGTFAPRGWAFCDGQLLPIAQNSALFSILGTIYGGDGRTTFALPDLRGRVAIHPGNGAGVSSYRLGQKGGRETVTLSVANIPSHNHSASVHIGGDTRLSDQGAGRYFSNEARGGGDALNIYDGVKGTGTMASDAVTTWNTGGGQSFDIRQPWYCVNYIIALQGVYPSRS
ncbi:MAG: tail fiber protein [Bacteroidota bacterium]